MINRLSDFTWKFLFTFFGLYIITLSFGFSILPDGSDFLGSVMQKCAQFTGDLFFGVNLRGDTEFFSDSLLQYVHVFNLVLISLIAAGIWNLRSKNNFTSTPFYPALLTTLRYFLALTLFIYGFSKIYKWQFPLPEPNILYQTVGNTPRDLLYWTSMGTSYTYSVFMGVIEVVPAILLLFRRTTLIGALIALLVMINVLFVNLGFDITVKLHSTVLFMMCVTLIAPARERLFAFFSGKITEAWNYPVIEWRPKHKFLLPSLKAIAIILLLTESNYQYFEAMNLNDDRAERIPMHGAYRVLNYCSPYGDSLVKSSQPERYLFVHSRGYIILMYENQFVRDYTIAVDAVKQTITPGYVFDGEFSEIHWNKLNDSIYEFRPTNLYSTEYWKVQKMNLGKLPLMQEEFGWIDVQ